MKFILPRSCIYSQFDSGTLPNGHTTKDSPFERSSPTANSTQATSIENSELSVPNGVKLSHNQEAFSQNSSEKHLNLLVSSDVIITAPIPENSEIDANEDSGVDRSTVLLQNNAEDLAPLIIEQPISNERSETEEVSNQKTEENKGLGHHPNLMSAPEPEPADALETERSDLVHATEEQLKVESEVESEPNLQAENLSAEETSQKAVEVMDLEDFLGAENNVDATITPSSPDVKDLPHHPPISVEADAEIEPPINPSSSTTAPAPETHEDSHSQAAFNDHVMQDAPPNSAKVARERDEDDMDDEPATKRTKTDDKGNSVPEFKVPDLPEIATNIEGAQAEASNAQDLQPITKPQQKYLLKVLQNIRRLNDSTPFLKPVDIVALNIPNYPNLVTKPMDLRTMEEKLKHDQYSSVNAYVNDFNQIEENSRLFNGPDHVVTKNAQNIKTSFDKQMLNLPGPEVAESVSDNKKKKASSVLPTKAPVSRRESRSSLPGSARSPVTAASPSTTFALGPQGVPLIRRDSTVTDGRPKREIHPPPPRDLPYANPKPKKRKYQWELKFCQNILNELKKPKYHAIAFPFLLPVDPVALNIPHYHKLIKHPMDLSTIGTKLEHGQYENAKEFDSDIRLMFQNCYKFNPAADPVHGMGKSFEAVYDDKWSEKASWIEANTPGSGPQTPGSSPDPDDDDEEEEEEDEEEEEQENVLTKLQQQIAAMSKQVELITKKKKTPPATSKKNKTVKATKEKGKKGASTGPPRAEKKTLKSAKKEKTPYVTYEQKQDISNRINSLPENRMATALKIIRENMPNLKVSCCFSNFNTMVAQQSLNEPSANGFRNRV